MLAHHGRLLRHFQALLVLLPIILATHTLQAQGPLCQTGCDPRVTVTPDGDYDVNRAKNSTGNVTTFLATNQEGVTDTFIFTCSATGGVTCTNITPASKSLSNGQSVTLTVTYSVGASGGQIKARMEGDAYADSGYKLVTTPPTLQLVVPSVTNGSDTALVHTRTPLILTTYGADAPIDTTTLVIKLGADTVTKLARRNSALAEWEVDPTHQLTPGVLTILVVKVCHVNSGCTTITRQVLLDNSGPPIVSFAGMPLEASPAGAEVETGFATPAYFSLGSGRSAGLAYSTRQSYPRALVNVDLELTWPVGNPDQIKAVLFDGALRLDSLVPTTPVCQATTGRKCRLTLQGDLSSSTFPRAVRKWLKVEVTVTSGGTAKITTDSVEAVIVDRRGSPYGSGWFVGGVARLDSAGTDMLLIGSSGEAAVYRGFGGTYLPPAGGGGILIWTGSQWELRPKLPVCGTTAKIVFDAQGLQTVGTDCYSNATRIKYAAVDRVDSIMDPLNKRITFAYNGSLKLTTLTDPGGRQSKVTINGSNQLVYDSLASPTSNSVVGTFAYTSYGGNNTVVLQSQSDGLGQTTSFSYDARRRPTQTTFPAVLPEAGSTPLSAVITTRAQVLRGLDTLLSADSLFGQGRDPRGYWSRANLNRWGQPLRTWDSLGTIGRATYSPEGRVLWAEGKVADSSRVYSSYDALERLVRSFRIRPGGDTLRLDSLVYNSNNLVITRLNPLNQATTFGYNSAGGVTSQITPTADTTTADTTLYQYTAQGQLQQERAPGQTAWTVYTYDATWKNLQDVTNAAGVVLATNSYDSYGRQIESRRKLTVKLSSEAPVIPDTMQWQRSLTSYDLFNRTDSAHAERTRNCAAPCNTPPAWLERLPRVSHFYDRLGRDTLRMSGDSPTPTQNRRTRYAYDGLGRLRMRWPFADSAAVVDSFRYDVAGNLRYQWTRRGYLIEHRYDARGRDTATIVPGIGTYRQAFTGPADELTRAWIDSYVDPIGGVNPEVRWSYSQSGLLLADTAQGNLATSRIYDRYGRDTSLTDVLGAWRIRYDGIRGSLDTIITPFSDTLRWTIDARGRYVGPYIGNAGNPDFNVVPAWDDVGKLIDLQTTQSINVGRWQVDQHMPDIELQVAWSEQQGSGGPSVSYADSIAHDGWGRVTAITYRKNGALIANTSFSFDDAGNITPGAESRTYDLATTRLTQRAGYSYRYDRAGNLDSVTAGSPAWKYIYDALDRLIEVRQNGSMIARYAYDAVGRRIVKRVYSGANAGYVRMIYRGGDVIADADAAGVLTFGYTRGLETDNLLAIHRYSDGSDCYVVQDPVGSVRGLTRRDGTWIASWRYSIYGPVIDSAGSSPFPMRYRWTGREYDAETGFYFFRSRFYDPAAQRFVREDPIGFAGGANLYAYGDGNPTNGRDPDGLAKDVPLMHDPGEPMWRYPDDNFCGACGGGGGFLTSGGLFTAYDLLTGIERDAAYNDYVHGYESGRDRCNSDACRPFYEGSRALDRSEFDRSMQSVSTYLLGSPVQGAHTMGITIQQRFALGQFLVNGAYIRDYNSRYDTNAKAVTSIALKLTVLSTGAFERGLAELAAILIHETYHSFGWGYDRECEIWERGNNLTGYVSTPPVGCY